MTIPSKLPGFVEKGRGESRPSLWLLFPKELHRALLSTPNPQQKGPRRFEILTLTLDSYCLPLSPQTGKQHWGFIQTVHFQASSFANK